MPPNETYDPAVLASLMKGLDELGPESTPLLQAAKPAIRRAIERGATSDAIRHEIKRSTGIELSPEQFRRLLMSPDGDENSTAREGVYAQALAARHRKQPANRPPREHVAKSHPTQHTSGSTHALSTELPLPDQRLA